MDQYLRNVKVIEDAFDQIKQATGISNIEEIVTTFIKAEEQNYSLQNYVNMLNTEFDQLEESNKDIREQIAKIVERGQMSNQEKLNLEKSLIDECAMLDDDIRTNLNEADTTKKQLRNIQKHVGIMVHMFKRSKFFLCVA
jgi:chromosome segregation ATPase